MTHPSRTAPSAAERAYRHLKQAVLEQVYPGGQLVSEGEIAEATGVSRTPVREALLPFPLAPECYWLFDEFLRKLALLFLSEGQSINIEIPLGNREF